MRFVGVRISSVRGECRPGPILCTLLRQNPPFRPVSGRIGRKTLFRDRFPCTLQQRADTVCFKYFSICRERLHNKRSINHLHFTGTVRKRTSAEVKVLMCIICQMLFAYGTDWEPVTTISVVRGYTICLTLTEIGFRCGVWLVRYVVGRPVATRGTLPDERGVALVA